MRLPWENHDQSQETNSRNCVTGPELPFFHKRKGILKIDQSVKKCRDIGLVWELHAPTQRLQQEPMAPAIENLPKLQTVSTHYILEFEFHCQ